MWREDDDGFGFGWGVEDKVMGFWILGELSCLSRAMDGRDATGVNVDANVAQNRSKMDKVVSFALY